MLNKIELIGRIVNEELKTQILKSGTEILYFTLAVSEGSGEKRKTVFIPLISYCK